MHSFIKRNQKKFLAVFSAGLMIAFMLPAAMKNSNGNRVVPFGTVGKTSVSSKDVADARAQWELLRRTVRVKRLDPRSGQETEIPVLQDQLAAGFGQMGPQVAQQIVAQIDTNPELFYLLVREAEEMGTVVPRDQVNGIIANAVITADDSPDYTERVEDAIHSLLLVRNTADRAADLIKVSAPVREQTLAHTQQISLNLVAYKASDYVSKLPAWSEADQAAKVKAQFEKYKNETPTTKPSNEFGFGYKVPNQAQVQYIEVPGDAVKRLVSSQVTDLDARKYFYQNRSEFPAEPSTQPATTQAAGTQPSTKAVPTSQPTTAPKEPSFEDMEKKVFARVIDERVNKLTREILVDINTQMGADYMAFKAAVPEATAPTATSGPTTATAKAPITPLGVPYNSYEYLQKLALNIQKKFGVLPRTNQDLGLRTEQQLRNAGDIANASLQGFDLFSLFQQTGQNFQAAQQIAQHVEPLIQFPVYVTNFVTPLANPGVQQEARNFHLRVLGLFEPSPLLQGRSSALSLDLHPSTNEYIFRIVAAEPAHAPKMEDVVAQVTADAKLVEAQNLALAAAKEFLKGIPTPYAHLEPAAAAAGKKVTTTGLFSLRQPMIENLTLPPGDAEQIFVRSAYQLLNSSVGDRNHPVGLIDFKPSATVYVAEINQVKPFWTPGDAVAEQVTAASEVDQQTGMSMRLNWFSPSDIRARMHFVPAQPPKKGSLPEQPAEEPPINPLGGI